MSRSLRLLLIVDLNQDTAPLLRQLRRGGFSPISQRVSTADEMSLALARQPWDLIVGDTTLPQFPGEAARALLKKSGMQIPFLALPRTIIRANRSQPGSPSTSARSDHLADFLPAVRRKMSKLRRPKGRAKPAGILRYLAEYDPLTNLPNRNYFHEQLQQAIQAARKESSGFAVLVLGLDRFREINHTLGGQNGDSLLREVARRFAIATHNCATIGRLGGTEFAAIFPHVKENTLEVIATNLLRMLEAPCFAQEIPIDLSATLGAACYPQDGQEANFLIQRAHIALDRARQLGRDFALYAPADDPYGQQKLAYLGGLRQAIEQNQLLLHYQPKVDLESKRTYGVEALVRWNHPQIGLVQPHQFIYVAERTGLIHALTQWVLRTALDQCRDWRREGLDMPVAVNLSPRNFYDHHLPESIGRLLEERDLPPHSLELEITESVIMADAVHVSEALHKLWQMGVRAYIDDFGTGYSSLGYLKKLPVAGIKIDKGFVSQMILDDNDAVIVRSTIELGHNLGLKVVAEGVESAEICDRLATLRCDAAQGFSMCRPKPAAELDHWFAESPWGVEKNSRIPEQQH